MQKTITPPIHFTWSNQEALSIAAAHYFVRAANTAIAARDRFVVALSGGTTPKRLFELLATPEFGNNIQWKKVFIFWSDERFVHHQDPESNYHMAAEALLNQINIPKKNIFITPTKGNPEDCAMKYEQLIKQTLGKGHQFDLILLGMGDDGHTASLFPNTEILKPTNRLVKAVWVNTKQTWRISFTFPLINKSKEVFILVSGSTKAAVLKKVFAQNARPLYPIQKITLPKGIVVWMTDKAALS